MITPEERQAMRERCEKANPLPKASCATCDGTGRHQHPIDASRWYDTQCFTTEQYKTLMFADLRKSLKDCGRPGDLDGPYWHDMAKKQLSDERLVEVKPDVWADVTDARKKAAAKIKESCK
jgi:hypothetical protein